MNRKNILVVFAVLQIFFVGKSYGQYDFLPDQTTGKPLTVNRYENVSGTPYLIDSWSNGEVKLANGTLVKPKAVKFDVVDEKLLFKQDDKVFEFFPKVAAFTLILPDKKRTFLLKDSKGGYFELLADGNVKLLKKTKKTVLERKGYNSASVEKIIDENVSYFLITKGGEKEVKLTKKSFMSALPEYRDAINNQSVTEKSENSFANLVDVINKI